MTDDPLLAVDIGNSRMKLGQFEPTGDRFPEPTTTLEQTTSEGFEGLRAWLDRQGLARASWWIASVNRPVTANLVEWLQAERPADQVHLLEHRHLTMPVKVTTPERLGVDRWAGALAADHLRKQDQAAIVIDLGSAITVDVVSAAGIFQGGAILPGLNMAARALHEFTDLLPLVASPREPPTPVGRFTEAAIEAGVFWGAVGAIRELVARQFPTEQARQVFFTGGAAAQIAPLVDPAAQVLPHLVLSGIVLAARSRS